MGHYRDDMDYADLLGDDISENEEYEEGASEPAPERQEENLTQECQEYYERRERLKELERQRLRRSNNNGKSSLQPARKPLPYDNNQLRGMHYGLNRCRVFGSYGSFFGPSEPVVAKRIIYEVRAREMASKVVARQAQEVSDIHKASKASSVTHSDTKPMEELKQSKAANEAAIRLQKLKEARDYSFLFTDEDPSASPRKDETRPTTKERQDSKPTKPVISSKEKPNVAPRMLSSGKPVAPLPQKSGMGGPRVVSKAHEHTASDSKSKTSERFPSVVKAKVASQSVSGSNVTKISSGPGRPAQSQQNLSVVSKTGSGNGKKPSALSVVTGSKISALKGSDKQSVPSTSTKQIPGKGVPLKSTPVAGLERKLAQTSVSKGQISAALPDQKRPGVAIVGQGSSLKGHYEQKRPPHPESLTKSKPVLKPPPKTQKRPRNANPFLDDDDDAGDVSSMIRKMFGYNPNKYRDLDDEDDRMMEANFHTIQMEEKRSARIAREEDERELALIEEEERRERELAKKRRKQQR